MKISQFMLLALTFCALSSCKNNTKDEAKVENEIEVEIEAKANETSQIIPISHGTLVIETEDHVIYVDPTGGSEAFKNQKKPTLVLITDIHGDHLSVETLEALNLENVLTIVPQAVADQLPENLITNLKILENNDATEVNSLLVEAIPMYNLREEALKFHTKGRGNGYVLTTNEERIYISGDTEDIPEMRNLKDIDKALVCMNLPYTMPVERAASAVLDFKPKQVYPYHYRGSEGLSDVSKFKTLVNEGDESIEVLLLDWY